MVFKPFNSLVLGLVIIEKYRVLFNGIPHLRLKSRTIEHFYSGIGSQNLQNLF